MYKFVFQVCSAGRELQPHLSVVNSAATEFYHTLVFPLARQTYKLRIVTKRFKYT